MGLSTGGPGWGGVRQSTRQVQLVLDDDDSDAVRCFEVTSELGFVANRPSQIVDNEDDCRVLQSICPDVGIDLVDDHTKPCLLYTSPSPRDRTRSRMPS